MKTINDGGAAFPLQGLMKKPAEMEECKRKGYEFIDPQTGMSLRDWFAGMALQGMAASEHWSANFDTASSYYLKDVSKVAYAAADAMIAERNKVP